MRTKNFQAVGPESNLCCPYSFMIWLTVVRNSYGSHGTVGEQQDSEAPSTGSNPSIYLYISTSIKRLWIIQDCFFSTLVEIKIFRRFQVGVLWFKKLLFVRTLILFYYDYHLQDHNEISTFFPNCFAGIIFWSKQRQLMGSTGKFLQTTKGLFHKKFVFFRQKTFDEKTWYPLLCKKFHIRIF